MAVRVKVNNTNSKNNNARNETNKNGGNNMNEKNSNEQSKKYEWFTTFFGEVTSLPVLTLRGGQEAVVTILMDEPGIRFKNNQPWRPYLKIEHNNEPKILWLHKKSLALKILWLQQKYGSLKGLKIKIRAPTGEGNDKYYVVEVLEE